MVRIKLLAFLLLLALGFSACAPGASWRSVEQAASPATANSFTVEPTLTAQDQVTSQPVLAWPEQPVIIASGDQRVPVVIWLPNGELLFVSQQDGNDGAYWRSAQGRAVYVDFAEDGAPMSGSAERYAMAFNKFSPVSLTLRLTSPSGALRTTHNVRIVEDADGFPEWPPDFPQDVNSMREAASYAATALESFACTASRGASGDVRLTFDWACSSQAAHLARVTDLTQWPVMMEPVSSSLALACPSSPAGSSPLPLGQCAEEMADWVTSQMTAALQAQGQAVRNAATTATVVALTPATEQAEFSTGGIGTAAPTSTLGVPGGLNAGSEISTPTPSPVPTGDGICGWLQALPGVWEREGELAKGDVLELEFGRDGDFQAALFEWPEGLRGNAYCRQDGTLKLNFRQGFLYAVVHLAEDQLILDVFTAIGLPAFSQRESWQFARRLD